MKWIELTDTSQLKDFSYLPESVSIVVIFKHSTRCSISSLAKNRVESFMDNYPNVAFLYLDLIKYRSISNHIAEIYSVEHQSPQVIVIDKHSSKPIFDCSHTSISEAFIKGYLT